MTRAMARFACFLPVWLLLCVPSVGGPDHPFILWTRAEAKALRKRIETEDWAREAYAELPANDGRGAEGFTRLFRYGVMGDEEAGRLEKDILLGESRAKRDYLEGIRYDVLYDLLTKEERARIEADWRKGIEQAIAGAKERRADYNRFNWLPNLGYPWYLREHIKAAALRDKDLMQKIFSEHFGIKWYLDEYLCDMGFYNEEFGKAYNTPDGLLLWGRACRRMGMDEIGFGYTGKKGATIRGHIESFMRLGMPRIDLGTTRPHYPQLTIGDAKGSRGIPAYGFQHGLVNGWLKDDKAGRIEDCLRLGGWCWFEMGHAEWPEAGFGYFLAQRRAPDEDRYYPSLWFGLDPIDPETVRPPLAPSGVYTNRGLFVLRADEDRTYWASPAPAVGMRLATPYAHHIQDCFCLTGFVAFNRQLFMNRQVSSNYSGVDPGYSNSSRSHSTVIVDFLEPRTIGIVPTRHDFNTLVKFAAARAKGIHPGVEQERALLLTRDYLVDVFSLWSDRPRNYHWQVMTFGHPCPEWPTRWASSRDLAGSVFDFDNEQSLKTDETWSVSCVQSSGGAHPEFSGLGESWFRRRVGVRTTVLGEPGTTAYTAWAPTVSDTRGRWCGRNRFQYGEDEPAGIAVAAVRRVPATAFVAVHEPFDGARRLTSVRRVAQDGKGVVLRIATLRPGQTEGRVFTDYVMLSFSADPSEKVSLGAGAEHFVFRNYAYLRLSGRRLHAMGGLEGFRLPAAEPVADVELNGRAITADQAKGVLSYQLLHAEAAEPRPEPPTIPGPVACRWSPTTSLRLPTGGTATRRLTVRNTGVLPVTARLQVKTTGGLSVEPGAVTLEKFRPGAERVLDVAVRALKDVEPNRLFALWLASDDVEVQPARLDVAHGVVAVRDQARRGDPTVMIHAPRYLAKVHPLASGAAALLLDPQGYRRTDNSGRTWPGIVRWKTDRGKEAWVREDAGRFAYFVPSLAPGEGERLGVVYEAGEHAHGATSGLEHWFTEDWIVVKLRKGAEGEEVGLDWRSDAPPVMGRRTGLMREKLSGTALVGTTNAVVIDVTDMSGRREKSGHVCMKLPKDLGPVTGVFRQPDGYDYGEATFYPEGSKFEKGYVIQPADKPMAFTYCKEDEFPALLQKWLKAPHPGVATGAEKHAYGHAYMPHLERGE